MNTQLATAGGAAALYAQDGIVKRSQTANALNMVGAQSRQRRVLDRAGVTKVGAAKKR